MPVDEESLTEVGLFGGTESAWLDHLAYVEGRDNYNYDGYCQGYHCGLDLYAEWGTSVQAGTWGIVSDVVDGGANGGYKVLLEYGDKQIRYEHLESVLVKPGQGVHPDTIIGSVGSPNLKNGNNDHVHLEIRFSSTGQNPRKDRISNPLGFMNKALSATILDIASNQSWKNGVLFHSSNKDPLTQPIIVRGGPVRW